VFSIRRGILKGVPFRNDGNEASTVIIVITKRRDIFE